jgi:hypothetical protein
VYSETKNGCTPPAQQSDSPQKTAKDLGIGNTTIKDWRKNQKDI